jgi:PBP1b-binding outer membrane lipoprotein LpoB
MIQPGGKEMKMKANLILMLLFLGFFTAGCATTPTSDYVPSDEPGASSNKPRPYDVRSTVSDVIESMFREWDFKPRKDGSIPIIGFTGMQNDSNYNWNITEIIGWIEQDVVRSKKATFSTIVHDGKKGGRSGGQLAKIVDAGADEDNEYFDQGTAPKKGRFQLPDYELFGKIYAYDEIRIGNKVEVNYVIELTLGDVERAVTVWSKMVPIRKNVPR